MKSELSYVSHQEIASKIDEIGRDIDDKQRKLREVDNKPRSLYNFLYETEHKLAKLKQMELLDEDDRQATKEYLDNVRTQLKKGFTSSGWSIEGVNNLQQRRLDALREINELTLKFNLATPDQEASIPDNDRRDENDDLAKAFKEAFEIDDDRRDEFKELEIPEHRTIRRESDQTNAELQAELDRTFEELRNKF